MQWFSQKSGSYSAVSSEFVIAGMIFHHSRVKSELLPQYIEQALVEVTLCPTCHRAGVWRLILLPTQGRSAYEIARCQCGVAMKIHSGFCACVTVEAPGALCAVAAEKLALKTRPIAVYQFMAIQTRISRAPNDAT